MTPDPVQPDLPDKLLAEINATRAVNRIGTDLPVWDAESWANAVNVKCGQLSYAAMLWDQPETTGDAPERGREEFRTLLIQIAGATFDALELLDLTDL